MLCSPPTSRLAHPGPRTGGPRPDRWSGTTRLRLPRNPSRATPRLWTRGPTAPGSCLLGGCGGWPSLSRSRWSCSAARRSCAGAPRPQPARRRRSRLLSGRPQRPPSRCRLRFRRQLHPRWRLRRPRRSHCAERPALAPSPPRRRERHLVHHRNRQPWCRPRRSPRHRLDAPCHSCGRRRRAPRRKRRPVPRVTSPPQSGGCSSGRPPRGRKYS